MRSIEQFIKDRNEALLSMDFKKLVKFARKYNQPLPKNMDSFWLGIHKARTGIPELPKAERLKSKKWLKEKGLESLDDGDLSERATE